MSERESLMKMIMVYSFAAFEWHLYLDTHPCDKDAIRMFHDMVNKANEYRKVYLEKFGPIEASESRDMEYWNWIDSPWPWAKN